MAKNAPDFTANTGMTRTPTTLCLGPAGAGELGVLLEPHQRHVRADERQHDARDQQDVQARTGAG